MAKPTAKELQQLEAKKKLAELDEDEVELDEEGDEGDDDEGDDEVEEEADEEEDKEADEEAGEDLETEEELIRTKLAEIRKQKKEFQERKKADILKKRAEKKSSPKEAKPGNCPHCGRPMAKVNKSKLEERKARLQEQLDRMNRLLGVEEKKVAAPAEKEEKK